MPDHRTHPNAPDLVQEDCGYEYEPSWSGHDGFISADHEDCWNKTQHLEGWQNLVDSQKLYEMGFHAGSVILEIGVYAGRSAVVELMGANAQTETGGQRPQYFGLDIDQKAFTRGIASLTEFGLLDQSLFYHGSIDRFFEELPIGPTMVFVDGSHQYPGVYHDLRALQRVVAPGTPLLCHDYRGFEGVNQAVNEWVDGGVYEKMGQFAGSILLRATDLCTGSVRGLSPETFDWTREKLLSLVRDPAKCQGEFTSTAHITARGRAELACEGVIA